MQPPAALRPVQRQIQTRDDGPVGLAFPLMPYRGLGFQVDVVDRFHGAPCLACTKAPGNAVIAIVEVEVPDGC